MKLGRIERIKLGGAGAMFAVAALLIARTLTGGASAARADHEAAQRQAQIVGQLRAGAELRTPEEMLELAHDHGPVSRTAQPAGDEH
ncbi:MAG TPA: hypothetical protein VD963_09090 [Phycisphaerales bacterium]|nr:hypothetical protein [Phycisphaerales bacterium]